MHTKTALILAGALMCSMIVVAQEHSGPTQAQRVVIDTPEVITLELAPLTRRRSADNYEKIAGPFQPESKIKFALVATNTSIIALDLRSWDTYSQNRPRLFRDNQEVAYRDGITDLLTNKDRESEIVHLFVIKLQPNEQKVVEQLDLGDWYEPLGSGHYELSTRHRFLDGGKWVDSASIVFEVEKKSLTEPTSKCFRKATHEYRINHTIVFDVSACCSRDSLTPGFCWADCVRRQRH